jgi:hypothetical protein
MDEFIAGVLSENNIGAQYEGAVYDRWLTLRHASGVRLKIFDLFPPISTELSVGVRREETSQGWNDHSGVPSTRRRASTPLLTV